MLVYVSVCKFTLMYTLGKYIVGPWIYMKPPKKSPKISLQKTVKSTMTTTDSVPLDAPDLDKDEAVIHAKKTPSYQRWLETHDGVFFTYAHWSYNKGDQ